MILGQGKTAPPIGGRAPVWPMLLELAEGQNRHTGKNQTMIKIPNIVVACMIAIGGGAAAAIANPALALTAAQPSLPSSKSAIALTSTVVRHPAGNIVRPVIRDSAGQIVNRLPGRSIGLGKPRKMQCLNYGGRNRCRPVA
ncbi:hypothetical protein QCM77_39910 [Bradyrhizobium sp. SSUT18]|uniref:hypothetical protein n=1 Tax=Bradyrhizobium sp. SSUT18 TaxID=3040602 RepID=UPI002446B785|nr:hypothetical protein [Bradyrhizobium sp. SSUT18]MDH2406019.1 hypothetical protein [Bradyrhizobium sp. SSUT18]